jgi:hypothetical protein
MQLTKEQIMTLKQSNVSKDSDKTKARVQADFKAATKTEKAAIVDLTGQKITAVYRVSKTGMVSAKIVVAMSQVLNVKPWYYTGEIEEREPEDGQISQFLKVHGYAKLAKLTTPEKPKRTYNKKQKPEPVADPATVAVTDEAITPVDQPDDTKVAESGMGDALQVTIQFSDEPKMKQAVAELTEQEAVELLHTLLIRAKGGGEAEAIADIVKRCLLK